MNDNILVLDNYDSFTYNLVHALRELGCHRLTVRRNDQITLEEVEHFDRLLLSPGPGLPREASILLPLIRRYAPTKPILGICLGHQAIAEAFGGTLINLSEVMHGITTPARQIRPERLFRNIPFEFEVGRYHSWCVDKERLPADLEVTAEDREGAILALRHKVYDVRGVQFHPESVLTPHGETILANWLYEPEERNETNTHYM